MDSNTLHYEPLVRLAERIRRRELSPVEVTQAMLHRIAKLNGTYLGYGTVLAERAMAQARQVEAEIGKGISRGPLHGVPVAVKDLCYTSFAPTAGGTTMFKDWTPGFTATVVERLEKGGAILLGKLKMTEGAYTSQHPNDQAPLNPWNPAYWVGSSSTGSGVATAAGLCFGSLGSDTGGSIRFPSATCNLTGIKPTWGRVSRHGVFALADSMDHIGPMTRSAADAAAMLGVIAGADPDDPTAIQDPVPDYLAEIGRNVRGLRVGIDRRYITESVDAQVVAAVHEAERVLLALGVTVREVAFPSTEKLLRGWIPLCAVETAIAHKQHFPMRSAEYGPALAQLIELGHKVGSLELGEIFHERLIFTGGLAAVFEEFDLLLMPTMPVPVPSLVRMSEYGQDDSVLLNMLKFTAPFDFAGNPTITLPAGFDTDGMPLSVQLVAPRAAEALLCRAGHAFQQITDWHTRHPPAVD
jgi:amidase